MKHLPIALLAFGLTAGGIGTAAGTPAPHPSPHPAPHSAKTHSAAANNPCAADNLSPTTRTVAPVAVYTTSGTVGNASALLNGQNTRLTGNGSAVTVTTCGRRPRRWLIMFLFSCRMFCTRSLRIVHLHATAA